MTEILSHVVPWDRERLNEAIKLFPHVYPIEQDMQITFDGISKMVMLDRYSIKDATKATLAVGDLVVLTVKSDPQYPARGIGIVQQIDPDRQLVDIWVEEAYRGPLEDEEEIRTGIVSRSFNEIDKPLEIFYEQIAKRNARGLSEVETDEATRLDVQEQFYKQLSSLNFVPAGRVLYGAGSETDVTYFNCYVMPFVPDSRGGIADHRRDVMEIMSRGGGVGSNGSTMRPRNAMVKGVNGKSSGAVSWLNDLASLTHLVEQGGSRRGAQMIMLADWHPDVVEFIISKMQNPAILRFLIEHTKDPMIKRFAEEKLKFKDLTQQEVDMYEALVRNGEALGVDEAIIADAQEKLREGGTYSVHNTEFLSGANISITITDDFMKAVEEGRDWHLRFPDVETYDEAEMAIYDAEWNAIGDVREWERMGHASRIYHTMPAQELWQLINVCATYSAEPGVFFIDNANKETNATAYGQKVVATNPCGEQPLAPFSVCNLAAVNLAQMANKEERVVDFEKLKETVRVGVRMQDNVIDATPYFLEPNREQALGERRVGLGVMGLADLLIYVGERYGSKTGNDVVDQVFETIAVTAYETSIELAQERGSFPFLIGQTEEETRLLRERFIHTGYMKKMPEHIRQGVLEHGIRNSHLLTVAPTGSTGTMAGVATGLEPYFAFKYYRTGRLGKFIEVNADIVQEYLQKHPEADADHLPEEFVAAMDLAPEEHVDVQTTIQRWVDSSISKTVNAPRGYGVKQVESIYERLYAGGAKGGTVYVDGSRDTQVLTLDNEDTKENKEIQLFEPEETRIVDDSNELRQLVSQAEADHFRHKGHADDVIFGSDVGDTCPICRQGIVEDIGGCNTCVNCGAQLRCGL